MIAFQLQTFLAPGIWVRFRVVSWLHCKLMLGSIWQESLVGAGLYFNMNSWFLFYLNPMCKLTGCNFEDWIRCKVKNLGHEWFCYYFFFFQTAKYSDSVSSITSNRSELCCCEFLKYFSTRFQNDYQIGVFIFFLFAIDFQTSGILFWNSHDMLLKVSGLIPLCLFKKSY